MKTQKTLEVQCIDMIVDFPFEFQHQVPTIQKVQRRRSSQSQQLDLLMTCLEWGRDRSRTRQSRRLLSRHKGRSHRDRFRTSKRSRRLWRYHKLREDSADHPEIQKTVEIPQVQYMHRVTVVAVSTQRHADPTATVGDPAHEMIQTERQMRQSGRSIGRQPSRPYTR